MAAEKCPLCKETAQADTIEIGIRIECQTCGTFTINSDALGLISNDTRYPRLSAWTRASYEAGHECQLKRRTFDDPPEALANGSISSKLIRALSALATRQPVFGMRQDYRVFRDWPLISDVGQDEAEALLRALEEVQWIKRRSYTQSHSIEITVSGWEQLESQAKSFLEPELCFLAMRFDSELSDYFSRVSIATARTGYRCERVDSEPHADHIDHRLIDYLKRCRFVIADFTHNSHNVYFEAGYALALGKPVIWTIREGEQPHFDTRQYYFRTWHPDRLDQFEQELEDTIAAIVGRLKPKGH